jgi:hypothetical protein
MNREERRAAERGQEPKDQSGVDPQYETKKRDAGTPQDVTDERAKNSRHGKVTADKWNQ